RNKIKAPLNATSIPEEQCFCRRKRDMSNGEQPATPAQADVAQSYDNDSVGGQVMSHDASNVHDGAISKDSLDVASSNDLDVNAGVMLGPDHAETNIEWSYSGSIASVEQLGISATAVNDVDPSLHVSSPIGEALNLPVLDFVNEE